MLKSVIHLVVATTAVLLHGCGGTSAYVNKQYQSEQRSSHKLVIVPLTRLGNPLECTGKCPPLEQVTDDHFEKSFTGLSGISLVAMADSRSFFKANPEIVDRLLAAKYSEEELSNNPSLHAAIDDKAISAFRERLQNADLLLVPSRFDLVPKFGGIFGYSEFRLYDLGSASLVDSASKEMNVNRNDEPGRGLMALVLIGRASEDFKKLYLER